eukprot:3605894-Amphidinium_carterae.1
MAGVVLWPMDLGNFLMISLPWCRFSNQACLLNRLQASVSNFLMKSLRQQEVKGMFPYNPK